MPDKLSLINDELLITGNRPVAEADDGSSEWNVASAGYETGVEWLLDEHDWKFATAIVDVEERIGDGPDLSYADEYAKPNGCLHLVWVHDQAGTPLDWKVVGNRILVNCADGITVKCVLEPQPDQWPGLFLRCLRHFVKAGIYRGLNKDADQARAEEKSAEAYLGKARPRSDNEEPGHSRFVSTLAQSRTRRRV
jgi:hypothetical protein